MDRLDQRRRSADAQPCLAELVPAGVDIQAVSSAPNHYCYWAEPDLGREVAQTVNNSLAELVAGQVSGSVVRYAAGGGPDPRSYRVDCSKLEQTLPAYTPKWTVERGIEQLRDAYMAADLTAEEFLGRRYTRLKHIRTLRAEDRLDADLRWASSMATVEEEA